jgi:hypothetical protein
MTTDKEKLKKIKGVLDRAVGKAGRPQLEYVKEKGKIIGVGFSNEESAAETMIRIEKEHIIYTKALERINNILGIERRYPKIKG